MQTDFQSLRVKMVDGQLRTTDVTNIEILSAFLSVRREVFVTAARRELAYLDSDIEVSAGRFMMEPSPLAKLLQLAKIASTDRVLIVGAGNGYSAAVIARLAHKVVALESNETLLEMAKASIIEEQIFNVEFVCSSLTDGAPAKAPYDVILVEGSVSSVPSSLLDQLSLTGRLIAVVGAGLSGVANCYTKSGTVISVTRGFNLSVKPLPGFELAPAFAF